MPVSRVDSVAVTERIRGGNQDEFEFAKFIDLVGSLKVRRYLEVGCRNGDTFYSVMKTIGVGGFGLAVDLPENSSSKSNLIETVSELNRIGIAAEVLFGDSQSPAVVEEAAIHAPFDMILIDADHRYEGVKRDFETYGRLAPVIALHDITAPRGHVSDGYPNEVGRLWDEIRGGFRHEEIVTHGSMMGFGIIYRC